MYDGWRNISVTGIDMLIKIHKYKIHMHRRGMSGDDMIKYVNGQIII